MDNDLGNNLPPTPEQTQVNSALPPAQKKWYQHKGLIIVIVLAILAAGVCWAYLTNQPEQNTNPIIINHKAQISTTTQQTTTTSTQPSAQPAISTPLGKQIVVSVSTDGKTSQQFTVDMSSRTLLPYNSSADPTSKDNLLKFSGLPKESKTTKTSTEVSSIFLSLDKTEALVTFSTYDTTAQPSEFDGSLPTLNTQEYRCVVASRQCTLSNITSQADKVGEGVYWYKWDTTKNILIGHMSEEGIGNASPVVVYHINTGKADKTVGYDSNVDFSQRTKVPEGAFSPSLAKFVMVTGGNPPANATGTPSPTVDTVLLYNTNNLNQPYKQFSVPISIGDFYGIVVVAWSPDENTLAFGTDRHIYTLDLLTGNVTLLYTNTTLDQSYMYWDYNGLNFSPDGRYVLFVSFSGGTSGHISTLKAIDLQNNNNVIDLKQAQSIILPYMGFQQ